VASTSVSPPPGDRDVGRLSVLLPWLLPLVATVYMVRFAPGPSFARLPYGVVLLGPVAVFLGGSTVVAAVREAERTRAARAAMLAGFVLAAVAASLAFLEDAHLGHADGRGQALLVVAMFGGAMLAAGRVTELSGRRPTAYLVLVALAVAAMLDTDIRQLGSVLDRDLLLYLRAGSAMLHGLPVYTDVVLHAVPSNPSLLPFVYPPPTVPFLAVLSLLPTQVTELTWLLLAVAASVTALRLFGVRWAWIPVLLAWPPFIQGFWTGNVNTFLLLAFAAAPRAPSLLALPPLVKLQLGLTGLWLPRERRWRSMARGLAGVAIVILATLPLVGLSAWHDWLTALAAFTQTTANIGSMQGEALARSVGSDLAITLAIAIALVALTRRGRDGLATLGLASLAISPTLYLHGLTPSLPSLLRLRGAGLWFLLAVTTSFARQQTWWITVAILVVAPLIPRLVAADEPDAAVHPIGRGGQVWPVTPVRCFDRRRDGYSGPEAGRAREAHS
jgi:hypothetical protein